MINTIFVKKSSFVSSGGKTPVSKNDHNSPKLLIGYKKELAELNIRLELFKIVFKHFKNPITCFKVLNELDKLRRLVLGERRLKKIAKVNGQYYWDLYTPGCGSKAFRKYIEGEINRFKYIGSTANAYTNVFLAITKKCSLKCEHCYEWENLNKKENLQIDDLISIVQNLKEEGIGQIQFSGGEPLLRINDLLEIMKRSSSSIEYWINTSGHKLTASNSRLLKSNGLTGAVISLDHYDKDLHNKFRGNDKSFDWAIEGIKNAQDNNIVTALSICVTKAFISEENLMKYAELARELKVSMIQILEPRAVGHYKELNVNLEDKDLKLLEEFYLKLNYDKAYSAYPIITYHGYHQRRLGCFAGGNRSFYIDTDGDIHACPFCQQKMGSALPGQFKNSTEALSKRGCHAFKGVQF